jgi:hypothetical protein
MTRAGKAAVWSVAVVLVLAAAYWYGVRYKRRQPLVLKGAVISEDADPRKELPIADAQITAGSSMARELSRSDSSGFFSLTLRQGIKRGQAITLNLEHPDYKPLQVKDFVGDKIYVERMVPLRHETRAEPNRPPVVITNVLARYSVKATTSVNVGSAVQPFEVVNTGNVPCRGRNPCSPDGKWKATIHSVTLDAGDGNEFRNARASCIAGPCPFTRIEHDNFSSDGRTITVSARNWSDTATFLVEAEVFHPMFSDMIRRSYPVVFGQALNFTMPAAAEGVSIEADLDRSTIVFPLGPSLRLSWADCHGRVNKDQTKVYRCELKPGYRFP